MNQFQSVDVKYKLWRIHLYIFRIKVLVFWQLFPLSLTHSLSLSLSLSLCLSVSLSLSLSLSLSHSLSVEYNLSSLPVWLSELCCSLAVCSLLIRGITFYYYIAKRKTCKALVAYILFDRDVRATQIISVLGELQNNTLEFGSAKGTDKITFILITHLILRKICLNYKFVS